MLRKFGFTGKSTFIRNIGQIISRWFDVFSNALYITCTASGTVFLSIGSGYVSTLKFSEEWMATNGILASLNLVTFNSYSALLVGGVLVFIGGVGTYRDQNEQKKQQELSDLNNEKLNKSLNEFKDALNSTQEELQEQKVENHNLNNEIVTIWLKSAFNHFGFNSTERITIYYAFEGAFFLLARHSKNPEYSRVHRQKFSLNQGVISEAWRHECHVEDKCPVFDENNEKNKPYANYLIKHYGYTADKIDALTMKSCRYIAIAVTDADTHVGVIVFESTKANFLENDLENKIKAYCGTNQGQLSKFVRDGLKLDQAIHIISSKNNDSSKSVEDEFLKAFEGQGT